MSLSEPVGEGVVLYHPVVVRYAEDCRIFPKDVFESLQKALKNRKELMFITWWKLSLAVGSYVGQACSKTYCYGWEYDEETRKLRSLFEGLVKPINEEIRLEDWM